MEDEILKRMPMEELDVISVEDWLEQMAQQGYFLDDVACGWWHFKIREPKEVRYRIDPDVRKAGKIEPQKKEDYEALGWHYVYTHKDMYHIFMAEDSETEELHTDASVESMALKRLEKSTWFFLVPFAILFIAPILFPHRGLGFTAFLKYPVTNLIGSDAVIMVVYLLYTYIAIQTFSNLKRMHTLRKNLAAGIDIRYDAGIRKRKRYNYRRRNFSLFILLLLFVSTFNSCSRGEDLDHILNITTLPVLADLETREVLVPVRDMESGRHGTTVWTYFNLFLQDNYEFKQEGIVPAGSRKDADGQPAASTLHVKYYKLRLALMAEPLYKEMKEQYAEENVGSSGFSEVSGTGFDSCAISPDGEKQALLVFTGKVVMLIEYEGGEALVEKIGRLEQIIGTGK